MGRNTSDMPSQFAIVEKFKNNYFRYHNLNVHSYCVSVCIMSEPLIIMKAWLLLDK